MGEVVAVFAAILTLCAMKLFRCVRWAGTVWATSHSVARGGRSGYGQKRSDTVKNVQQFSETFAVDMLKRSKHGMVLVLPGVL